MSLLLSACSQGSSQDGNGALPDQEPINPDPDVVQNDPPVNSIILPDVIPPEEQHEFAGRVVKGVISNALIKVYPIVTKNGEYLVDTNAVPITVRTNDSGYYQLKPSSRKSNSYYYLQMVTDDNTRMLCDLDTGCDSPTGSHVNFGEQFNLASGFTLSNVVKSSNGEINDVPISPLTHLATKKIESLPGRFSPTNITLARQFIEAKFQLTDNALSLTPADLTALAGVNRLKAQELKLGLLAAAFMPYITEPAWADLATLPIDEIFMRAGQIANFLRAQVSSTQQVTTLATVEAEIYAYYNNLNDNNLNEAPLLIQEQPKSIAATEGDNVQLSVVATGSEPFAYQWLKEGKALAGETNAALSFTSIPLAAAGAYSVRVSTPNVSIESLTALVSVTPLPLPVSITSQPVSALINEGQPVTFSVSASGGGLISYQWRKNANVIPNAYSSKFSIAATQVSDAGTYDVILTNSVSKLLSQAAALQVIAKIEPITILQQPQSMTVTAGSSATLSVAAGGGSDLSYQWFKDGSAIADAQTDHLSFATTSLNNQGSYTVIISNTTSSVRSEVAYLTVLNELKSAPVQVELSWDIPDSRVDGSALYLADIDGYKIAVGTELFSPDQIIHVASGSTTTAYLSLLPDSYYLSIATLTVDGIQSEYSQAIRMTIE